MTTNVICRGRTDFDDKRWLDKSRIYDTDAFAVCEFFSKI